MDQGRDQIGWWCAGELGPGAEGGGQSEGSRLLIPEQGTRVAVLNHISTVRWLVAVTSPAGKVTLEVAPLNDVTSPLPHQPG